MRSFFMLSRALNARKRKIFALFFALAASVGLSWAATVTWNNDDITGSGNSFTKDGVTITVGGSIDFGEKNFTGGGTFTTTIGNFTKIEVDAFIADISGEGWSGSTWTGNASSVSFSGTIAGLGFGITKFVFTIEEPAPAITKTITDNGMTYDIYDNGVVKVSGTGIVASRIFAANDHDYVTSVKRFEFADDCKVYSFGEDWYMYYTSNSPFEAADIKTTLPFVAGRQSVFYRKESADESVTVTITAPAIASINRDFVANYGTPQHIIFNMPVTTFEKNWCSYLGKKDTVTIPTGSLYHLPASYAFKDESTQFNYDYMAADGMEDMFWQYEGSGLVEGVDYTRTEEETGVITAENDSIVFGKAVVKYQAPQEAPATSWTFWRSDDFKTFPELVNGSSHTCKDVTLKIVDGSFTSINMSGSYITLSTSATNGIQLIAPKGKIFKQVIALDRVLSTPFIWTGEADTVGISSNLMLISLIEFELDAAPANPAADAQAAIDSINAIPDPVVYTEECKAKIDAARATLDALSDEARALLTEADTIKLPQAEAAYATLLAEKVTPVIAAIDSIPSPVKEADLKLSVYNKVTGAREAYDALTDTEKAAVTNYAILEAAEAAFAPYAGGAPAGALNGAFSIADEQTVYFSKGNLQATTVDLGTNWTWTFAANQYDCVAANAANTKINGNGTVSENGIVDLFGWSTAATTYGIHNSTSNSTYSGDFVDWGTNTDLIAALGSGWRTLTSAEWTYLLTQRTTTSGVRYAKAEITDVTYPGTTTTVKGLIIVPNDWQTSYHDLASTNTAGAAFTTNQITSTVWENELEAHGAVFLPAAGYRYGTSVLSVGVYGYYRSATPNGTDVAYSLFFGGSSVNPENNYLRKFGLSVRLVTQAVSNAIAEAQAAVDSINAIPAPVVYTDSCKALIDAARAAVDALGDNAKLIDDEDMAKLTAAEAAYAALDARPTPTFDPAPTAVANLKYTGEAQALITAGVATVPIDEQTLTCPVLYSLNGETYSENIPTGVAISAYTVYYKVEETEQHKAFGPATVNAQILKADAVFTAPAAYDTLVYNAAAQPLITAGVTEHGIFTYSSDGDTWSEVMPQATDAGNYTVYYRITGDELHSDVAATPVEVTIAKAALTATADDKAIIYGDEAPAFTVTYTGWQGDDKDVVLTGAIAFETNYTRGNNVGDYTITSSGVEAANYAITFVNGKLTVNPKSATSDDIYSEQPMDEQLIYNAQVNRPTIVVTDMEKTLIEGTDYTLTFTGDIDTEYAESTTAPTHVGQYKANVAFMGNYEGQQIVYFTIVKSELIITAENKEVTYGDETPEFTFTCQGLLGEDTKDVVTNIRYACEYTTISNVGEYTITPSGEDPQDYYITFENGTLTVNKAALMITAEDKSVIYGHEAPEFTATYEGWKNADDESVVTNLTLTSEYTLTSEVGTYTIVPSGAEAQNYAISYTNGTLTVNKAVLTITAEDKTMFYGDEAPEFTASYEGFLGEDDESLVSGLAYDCEYVPGSPIDTYTITPKDATADNYEITFVNGTLTVNKASLVVSGAEIQIAKFEDGTTDAVVLNNGELNGVKLNDPIAHITTAAFSDAAVGEQKEITVYYELTGDAALLNNYDLILTSETYYHEGIIIEKFIPDNNPSEKADDESVVKEGIEVYAYGYCDGSGYSLRYHLNSGNPDQYKIEFDDPRFEDVDWTNLTTPGKDGTIDIEIPVDMPTGDYTMTVTFRDSRFAWLESNPLTVTFHVNLPETYVTPLFENTIALVDTCNCFTDIQWYYRANASEPWQPIAGATGHYYHVDGKLTGEYFVKATMNGEPTYTCGQSDMETLYGADSKQPKATVKAFPNPVVTTTNVTIENSENWNHTLRIVNLMGVEVLSTTFEGAETKVDMGGFVQGSYMISVDGIVVKVMKK